MWGLPWNIHGRCLGRESPSLVVGANNTKWRHFPDLLRPEWASCWLELDAAVGDEGVGLTQEGVAGTVAAGSGMSGWTRGMLVGSGTVAAGSGM